METGYKPKLAWLIDRMLIALVIFISGIAISMSMPKKYLLAVGIATTILIFVILIIFDNITDHSEDSKILNALKVLADK